MGRCQTIRNCARHRPRAGASLRQHGSRCPIQCAFRAPHVKSRHIDDRKIAKARVITARGGTAAELRHLVALHAKTRVVVIVAGHYAASDQRFLDEIAAKNNAGDVVQSDIGSNDTPAPLIVHVPLGPPPPGGDVGVGSMERHQDPGSVWTALQALGPLPKVGTCRISAIQGEHIESRTCKATRDDIVSGLSACVRCVMWRDGNSDAPGGLQSNLVAMRQKQNSNRY